MRLRYTIVAILSLFLFGHLPITAQSGSDPSPQCAVIGRGVGGPAGEIQCRESALGKAPGNSAQIPAMLFWLAESYQTLGETKAEEYYKKLIKDYCKGSPALCTEAQRRLVALQAKNNAPSRINTPFTSDPYSFAISPDGQKLVYLATIGGKTGLWLHDLKTGKAVPIAGTESNGYGPTMGGAHPFWSPDGKQIGFFVEGKLKRIDAAGGVPETIADAPYNYGGSWSRDDVIIFVRDNINAVYQVAATGGVPQRITELGRATASHRFPQFLSDDRHFLFYRTDFSVPPENPLAIGSLDSSQVKALSPSVQAVQAARFTASDQLLVVGQRAVFAQRLDPVALELTGARAVVAEQVADFRATATPGYAAVSVSNTGVMAYRVKDTSSTQLVWFDRQGKQTGPLGLPEESASASPPRFSNDGRTVAVVTARSDGAYIRLINAKDGNTRSIYVADIARFRWDTLVWSSDGESVFIALTVPGAGNTDVYRRVLGSNALERFTNITGNETRASDMSSDGKYLLYTFAGGLAGVNDLRVRRMSDGSTIRIAQGARRGSGKFSPDGRWVAYEEGGPAENADQIRIQPFSFNSQATAEFTFKGHEPQWSSDGMELYFVSPDNRLMSMPAKLLERSGEISSSEATSLFTLPEGATYTPAEGQRFLLNVPLEAAPPIYVVSLPAAPASNQPLPSATPVTARQQQIMVFDRHGNPEAKVGAPYSGASGSVTLSPDGTQIATIRNSELSVTDISSNITTRVAMGAIQVPVWSGDGRRLAYLSGRDEVTRIYVHESNGREGERSIYDGAGTGKATSLWNWSGDGRLIGATIANRLNVVSVSDNRRITLVSAAGKSSVRLSPRGDFVAYISTEVGSNQAIFIRTFDPRDPNGYTQRQIATGAVGMIRWRADGQELYYLDRSGNVMAVPITTSQQISSGVPIALFHVPAGFPVDADISDSIADVSANGQRFVFVIPADNSNPR